MSQLRISLQGPGPKTGAANFQPDTSHFEVILFDLSDATIPDEMVCVGGYHNLTFDDSSLRVPEACCSKQYSGTYKPSGRLLEFLGTSPSVVWTLFVDKFILFIL